MDEKRIGVLMADVSGHGMPAALIASMIKVAFAAQSGLACDPAAVLSGLNQALCGKFQGHYVTAAYALIDTGKKTLCYAGAGHPPLLLRSHRGAKSSYLLENGLFLGFFNSASYSSVEVPFEDGDWAVFYTDGIPEMMNASEEQFGNERLGRFLDEHSHLPATAFADRLLEHLGEFSARAAGQEPDDDVTLLAVHFENV